METEVICLDTSVLIDYYRKKDKANSFFVELTKQHSLFAVSVITEYEVLVGSSTEQDAFWNLFFERFTVLPFTKVTNVTAIAIYRQLKKLNKLIPIPDLLISATALNNNMPIATLNKKDFENIDGLKLILKK